MRRTERRERRAQRTLVRIGRQRRSVRDGAGSVQTNREKYEADNGFDALPAELQDLYLGMQDDLYDGLKDEVVAATNAALERVAADAGRDPARPGGQHGRRRRGLPRRHPVRARGADGRQAMKGAMEILRPLLTDARMSSVRARSSSAPSRAISTTSARIWWA